MSSRLAGTRQVLLSRCRSASTSSPARGASPGTGRRTKPVNALGLDETLFARVGRFRTQLWSTQIVDVRRGQLLDVVPGRDSSGPCRWLAARDREWLAGIEWATLDLSTSYRTVFDTMLPDAVQVADPFHVVKLANTALDECRRRVQNETLGHRGRRDDPLGRAHDVDCRSPANASPRPSTND